MHIAGSALLKEAQPVGGERHQGQPGALNVCLFDSMIFVFVLIGFVLIGG